MDNVSVNLRPIITNLNLPTVIKTTYLPNDREETLFVATQVGEIFYLRDSEVMLFLDIEDNVLELGTESSGYDERGLLGLAFHPDFHYNGLFYLHYSLAGSQGPGALDEPFIPNPCDINTLNLTWEDRENRFDHMDTVEEWILEANGQPPRMQRKLLNLRRPFMNHNGVNSLNFSPETGHLVLCTGDGGSGFDPFNLSQDFMEIAGKIIEIDVDADVFMPDMPVVSRFDEIPPIIAETILVVARGLRNTLGLIYQWNYDQYIKYVGQVGQDLVESIYSYTYYAPIPVPKLLEDDFIQLNPEDEGFINLGWRGWEGDFPTQVLANCPAYENESLNYYNIYDNQENISDVKKTAYYYEAVETSAKRMFPLVSYFHQDPRPDKFSGSALTGVFPYMGNELSELNQAIIFSDFAKQDSNDGPTRGALGYTQVRPDCHPNDFYEIDVLYDFGNSPAYFVSMGGNFNQTKLYLGVYGSANVTDYNLGTIYELIR